MSNLLRTDQKADVLASYFSSYQPGVVIETGSWMGSSSCAQFADRARVILIDAQESNIELLGKREPPLELWMGDSAILLPRVLRFVREPALFWLDAHWMGFEDEPASGAPLIAELEAIAAWEHGPQSVVLIDDVRMLGSGPGWPSLEEIASVVPKTWETAVTDDILRFTPP